MAKEVKFGESARQGMLAGVNTLSDAVKAVSYTHLTLPTIYSV